MEEEEEEKRQQPKQQLRLRTALASGEEVN